MAIEYGKAHDMAVPPVYVSTAITSAGHRKHPDLAAPTGIPEAVNRNNRTGALLLGALAVNQPGVVTTTSVMAPTELGKVAGWGDTDYLLFYFAWLAGLTEAGAAMLATELASDAYREILKAANARDRTNTERWPAYETFAHIMISELAQLERRPGAKGSEGSGLLLQLVDVQDSLGCRAERMFADARGVDIVAASVAADIGGDIAADVTELHRLGATVGVTPRPIELVPVSLT